MSNNPSDRTPDRPMIVPATLAEWQRRCAELENERDGLRAQLAEFQADWEKATGALVGFMVDGEAANYSTGELLALVTKRQKSFAELIAELERETGDDGGAAGSV